MFYSTTVRLETWTYKEEQLYMTPVRLTPGLDIHFNINVYHIPTDQPRSTLPARVEVCFSELNGMIALVSDFSLHSHGRLPFQCETSL